MKETKGNDNNKNREEMTAEGGKFAVRGVERSETRNKSGEDYDKISIGTRAK